MQPIPELVGNNCGSWTLTLDIPIPEDMVHPTLTSLSYMTKYSTANDHWASVIQTNILLVTAESEAIPKGITTDLNHIDGSYRGGITVVPQTREDSVTMCLSSVPGVKENNLQGQWNHFVDRQQIPFSLRIVQSSRLYLQFHVSEYPTAVMLRSLSVDVSAAWLEDQEGRRLLHELHRAEMRAGDAEAKAADKEQARKAAETQQTAGELAKEEAEAKQHAAERQSAADAIARKNAEDEVKIASSERQAAEASAERHRLARKSAEENAEQLRLARENADRSYQVEHQERAAADAKEQTAKHALEEAEHKLQTAKEGSVANLSMRAKIKKTLTHLLEKPNRYRTRRLPMHW